MLFVCSLIYSSYLMTINYVTRFSLCLLKTFWCDCRSSEAHWWSEVNKRTNALFTSSHFVVNAFRSLIRLFIVFQRQHRCTFDISYRTEAFAITGHSEFVRLNMSLTQNLPFFTNFFRNSIFLPSNWTIRFTRDNAEWKRIRVWVWKIHAHTNTSNISTPFHTHQTTMKAHSPKVFAYKCIYNCLVWWC